MPQDNQPLAKPTTNESRETSISPSDDLGSQPNIVVEDPKDRDTRLRKFDTVGSPEPAETQELTSNSMFKAEVTAAPEQNTHCCECTIT